MTNANWMNETPTLLAYYQTEWGRPEHDDQRLFELLCLETYQAGLSWRTVLAKRPAFRQAFHQFEIAKVAAMTDADIDQLMLNPDLIRNRRKLMATINNAQVVLTIQREFGQFADYLWHFVDDQPIVNRPATWAAVPSQSPLSVQVARDLKKRGCQFVGPVIIYAYLQGAGLIDDHPQAD